MGAIGSDASGKLRLLATSDVHMHLSGSDHATPSAPRGLARLAPLIAEARKTAEGPVLMLDNGDALQGTPLARAAHEGPWDATHPLVAVMTQLGYDAFGLGNHDFDFGVDYLEAICAALPCPVLSANTKGFDPVETHVLLQRMVPCSDGETRPVTIGLTSALPDRTGEWLAHALDTRVSFAPALECVHESVSALLEVGADVIVLLAHSGFESGPGDRENFVCAAAQIPGVTAIVAGHTHFAFPSNEQAAQPEVDADTGKVHGLPCVMPGFGANCLGQIDLDLTYSARSGWRVAGSASSLLLPNDTSPDPQIEACLAPAKARLATQKADIIGKTDRHLHSYFAMLAPNPLIGLLGQAMIDGLGALGLPPDLATLPRVASVAPALSGGRAGPTQYVDIPPGPVYRDALDMLCPFEDRLCAKVVSGEDLKAHLDRAAAIFRTPDADASATDMLVDEMPGFFFDMIFGLGVSLDLTRPARFDPAGREIDPNASRITRLEYEGVPVKPDQSFLLAMTSYRAGGGGAYPQFGMEVRQDNPPPPIRDLVETRLARGFSGSAPDWSLARKTGLPFSYLTSPKAVAHLDDIAAFGPTTVLETPGGFLKLGLIL